MTDFDLHQWFSPEELDRCPACGEPAGVTLPATGSFVCLSCGHVSAGTAEAPRPKPSGGTTPVD
jgi:ribosomal protein L37AE/L43A